jgi:hypothetical protein
VGAVGLAAGIVVWLAIGAGQGTHSLGVSAAGGRPPQTGRREVAERRGIERRVRAAVKKAAALGGEIESAVMLGHWQRPVVVASPAADVDRPMRMWSISKAVTMVALLREEGWGQRPGKPLSPEVDAALEGAIERSENCPQRRVVVELERVAGSIAAARAAVAEVLARAGAEGRVATETAPPEGTCIGYLAEQEEVDDPLGPALLLGTSTWRIGDAVRFAHALATERFGAAISRRVLGLMRIPKARSREVVTGEFTAAPDWGAGRALAGLEPAYKAGWGGTQQQSFMAAQLTVVSLPGAPVTALAVAFHPFVQPPIDDPGLTAAPRAIDEVIDAMRRGVTAAGR